MWCFYGVLKVGQFVNFENTKLGFVVSKSMKYENIVFGKFSFGEICLKKRLFRRKVNKELQHLDRRSLWDFMKK